MNINRALKNGNKKLKKSSRDWALLDTEVLLAFVLKKDKEFLYTHPGYIINKPQLNKFNKLIGRQRAGEPVAYLTGQKEFFGLNFYVDKRVLIPRPVTELLVEQVLADAKKYRKQKIVIGEIGVGSGAIIIALAKNLAPGHFRFIGVDISPAALEVAQKNARLHQVKIKFYRSDLMKKIAGRKIDILIANLPYLKPEAIKNHLKFEPRQALLGGQSGWEIFQKLFQQIANLNFPPKIIFLEIGDRQAEVLKKLKQKLLPQYRAQIKKDLCGLDRLLILKMKGLESG